MKEGNGGKDVKSAPRITLQGQLAITSIEAKHLRSSRNTFACLLKHEDPVGRQQHPFLLFSLHQELLVPWTDEASVGLWKLQANNSKLMTTTSCVVGKREDQYAVV